MAFSDNLLKIREFRGKKPIDVVSGTSISKQKYSGYEKGKFQPSPEIVDELAEFFNVPRELFYKKEVKRDDLNPRERSFKDEIFEGDYVGVHKSIWESYQNKVASDTRVMESLAGSLAEAVRKLSA